MSDNPKARMGFSLQSTPLRRFVGTAQSLFTEVGIDGLAIDQRIGTDIPRFVLWACVSFLPFDAYIRCLSANRP